ncbi:hypothetical protein, partial [Xanthomonas vasicola]|uniref:hypothetical protein n=1 Tax=Xanthomonas vasicola TaxID=56459 RepID=UPI001D082604
RTAGTPLLSSAMRIWALISASRLACGTFPNTAEYFYFSESRHEIFQDSSIYRLLGEVISTACTGAGGHMASCCYVLYREIDICRVVGPMTQGSCVQ